MTSFDIRFPQAEVSSDATVEDGVTIGAGTVVESHCSIYNGAEIGKRCTIRSGARIGTLPIDFRVSSKGIERSTNSQPVIIGDNCDIGHNSVIQNGVERNTTIGEKTLVNNLCNIGHDVQIGPKSTVGLSASISGHTTIGTRAEISPGVTILNRVTLGADVTVGIGSLVLHDFGDGSSIAGRPAVTLSQYKKERKLLKEAIFGEYTPSKISTSRNKYTKLLKRIIRRFI